MATYKFVDTDQLDSDLTVIAEAIREKGGTETKLAFPEGMKSAIAALVGFNFSVTYGTSSPADPSENTIWINMQTRVADVRIGTEHQENPSHGSVLIVTGASSQTPFAATTDGTIFIYPIRVERCTINENGTGWEAKEAQIWQNGAWHTISE